MSDLISRQEVINLIKDSYYNLQESMDDTWAMVADVEKLPSVQPNQKWETCFDCPLSHGCPKINGCTNGQTTEYASEVPDDCPISVQPRKGKWIKDKNYDCVFWRCSECGRKDTNIYNFCPNCGTDMREGEQDG